MKRVQMPADVDQSVTFSKRSMREAWPAYDEQAFRADLAELNHAADLMDEMGRNFRRSDAAVNVTIVVGFVVCVILMVSGY